MRETKPVLEVDRLRLENALLRVQVWESRLQALANDIAAREGFYGWDLDMNTWTWSREPQEEATNGHLQ